MIALLTEMAAEHNRELQRVSAGRRHGSAQSRAQAGFGSAPRPPGPGTAGEVSIRRLGSGDRSALERLAGRDSAPAPEGELLGAEQDGRLIAAVSLSSGELVADPFTPSAGARTLLELRAAQLGVGGHRAPATGRGQGRIVASVAGTRR